MTFVDSHPAEKQAFAIADELAANMGVLNVATDAVLDTIARAIDTESWQGDGIRSPEHYVAFKCGVTPERAARMVHAARRRHELPTAVAELSRGAMTEDQFTLIARRVPTEYEAGIAAWAGAATITQLRRGLRDLPQPEPLPKLDDDDSEPAPEPRERVSSVRFANNDDGRWWARMDLTADLGALIEKALVAGRDHAFRQQHPDRDPAEARIQITWTEGLEHLAHAALDALDPETRNGRRPGDRYQALIHIDADHPENSRLHLGPVLPAWERRYLTCDCDLRPILWRNGHPVAAGRRTRTIDPILRALIEERDQTCRVPGCPVSKWLHIHHVVHWEDEGPTDPENLAALCPFHHREHHAGRLGIMGDASTPDGLTFTDSDGRLLQPGRARPPSPSDMPHAPPYYGATNEQLIRHWITLN